MARNPRVRFLDNNHAELTSNQTVYSSQLAAFPFSNAINKFRSKVWKPSGYFLINANNYKLYINDGTDKTISLTQSSTAYTTPALLATHIQTQLNASSSGWTVSYSSTTFKFTISRSSSATLRFSQTTDSVWDTIGYTLSSDSIASSWVAQEQRNHTEEFVTFDLGFAINITAFCQISPLGQTFPFSNNATIKLQANNLNTWDTPPLDITLTPTGGGIFKFLDDLDDSTYRHWRFWYEDKYNPEGPNAISIGHIYLGDYTTFEDRIVGHGFEITQEDKSSQLVSENGAIYFNRKTKHSSMKNLTLSILKREDKDYLQSFFEIVGITTPFYICLDPLNQFTTNLDELMRYVVFESPPRFTHIMRDFFSTSLELRELV